jgi:hypothetical protein
VSVMPFFTAVAQRKSKREAGPTPKAPMFSAGETGTTVISLVAAFFAWQSGIPGGGFLLSDGGVECGGDDRHHRHAEGGLR